MLRRAETDAGAASFAGADIEDIREIGLTLHEGVATSDNTDSTVYPQLHFTCSGSITSFWFIASEREGPTISEPNYLEFQLWRGNRFDVRFARFIRYHIHNGTVVERISPSSSGAGLHLEVSGEDVSLYQFVLEQPILFEAGDILGIEQTSQSPLQLWSLIDGGVRNYEWTRIRRTFHTRAYRTNFSLDREPLVALEGEWCTHRVQYSTC